MGLQFTIFWDYTLLQMINIFGLNIVAFSSVHCAKKVKNEACITVWCGAGPWLTWGQFSFHSINFFLWWLSLFSIVFFTLLQNDSHYYISTVYPMNIIISSLFFLFLIRLVLLSLVLCIFFSNHTYIINLSFQWSATLLVFFLFHFHPITISVVRKLIIFVLFIAYFTI